MFYRMTCLWEYPDSATREQTYTGYGNLFDALDKAASAAGPRKLLGWTFTTAYGAYESATNSK